MKRLLVYGVQKYVKKMIPPITFAHTTFSRALAAGADRMATGADPKIYAHALDLNSVAALQYTGGTTGVAKGATLTHGNLVANTVQGLEMWKPFLRFGQEVMLTALPLYHIFAFTANLMIFYLAGGRNILIPSPRPLSNLKTVMLNEPVTWFTGVNTLFAGLDARAVVQGEIDRWSLRGSVAGGMALVPVIGERWEAMTKTPIYQGYGLTETSPVATLNPFNRPKREAIGVPVPGTDVRLVDNDGQRRGGRRSGRVVGEGAAGDAGLLAPARRNRARVARRLARHRRHREDGRRRLPPHRRSQEGHDPRQRLQRVSERG